MGVRDGCVLFSKPSHHAKDHRAIKAGCSSVADFTALNPLTHILCGCIAEPERSSGPAPRLSRNSGFACFASILWAFSTTRACLDRCIWIIPMRVIPRDARSGYPQRSEATLRRMPGLDIRLQKSSNAAWPAVVPGLKPRLHVLSCLCKPEPEIFNCFDRLVPAWLRRLHDRRHRPNGVVDLGHTRHIALRRQTRCQPAETARLVPNRLVESCPGRTSLMHLCNSYWAFML